MYLLLCITNNNLCSNMKKECGNLIDYVKDYSNKDFCDKEFSLEDAVVFASLAYLYFERINKKTSIFIKDILEYIDLINKGAIEQKRNPRLIRYISKSKRFKNIKVCYGKGKENRKDNFQFGAVTFCLPNKLNIIAFRGTSLDISGWIENLNMSVDNKTKCQMLGAEYVKKVMKKIDGNFIILGHSKGGNTSIYASMNQSRYFKDRIIKVYDLDGPGFKDNVYKLKKFKSIEEKVTRVVIKDDIVGCLLNTYQHYLVIDCFLFSFMAHDLYNWKFESGKLKIVDSVNSKTQRRNKRINNWISSLSKSKKVELIQFINDVTLSYNENTFKEILVNPLEFIRVLNYIKNHESYEKRMKYKEIVKNLINDNKHQ